jgi:hypothetical protein
MATIAAPSRHEILGSLGKLSLCIRGEAGLKSRSRPFCGLGSANGTGTRGWPFGVGAGGGDLDSPARRGEP